MRDRQAIIEDSNFWSRVEYAASAWLASSAEKQVRRFWIDGFVPESAGNTQRGANIEGMVWLAEGSRQQSEYRFVASIPQKLLHRRESFAIDDISIDETEKQVALSLSAVSSPNRSLRDPADVAERDR